MAEVYSAVVVAAITIAVSYVLYSLAAFHVSPAPVYSVSSYAVYGSPSLLRLQVNATSGTSAAEFRIDRASSLSGILEVTPSGYSNTSGLCSPGATTFFAVQTSAGILGLSGSGTVLIDGDQVSTARVVPGWHEIVVSNGSGCTVALPGGAQVSSLVSPVSAIPLQSASPRSFIFLIPFYASGHTATVVFDGGVEAIGF